MIDTRGGQPPTRRVSFPPLSRVASGGFRGGGHIIAYLKDHPRSTTGAVAKAVNASRATIAAPMSHVDAPRRRWAPGEH